MDVVLGQNEYGKSEIRLAQVGRNGDRHDFRDLSVSIALSGDFADVHLTGDNTNVLPTDTQKNTVYAFAKKHGVGEIEDFASRLAQHFVDSHGPVRRATVTVDEYRWARLGPHSFTAGSEVRHTRAGRQAGTTELISGLSGLRLINTTGSEFTGFARDRYTTLPEARDRILATRVSAQWRPTGRPSEAAGAQEPGDWATSYAETRRHLIEAFIETYSYSLQQTLYAMGTRVLQSRPEIAAIRLSLPNIHHTPVDLSPFGLANDNEIFVVSDRPFGLIEATVARDEVADSRGATTLFDDGGWPRGQRGW
jgi:urate oxidase